MPALVFDKRRIGIIRSRRSWDDGAEWKNCFQRSYNAALFSVGKAARRFSTGSGIGKPPSRTLTLPFPRVTFLLLLTFVFRGPIVSSLRSEEHTSELQSL